MPYLFSPPVTVAVDVVAWAAIHAGTGYLVHRLAVERLATDWWIHRPRRFERGGSLYADRLRVRRWKHRLPEAGALFGGGFDKRSLGGAGRPALERYAVETRRAELGHWLAAAGAPAFFLWNPWPVGVVMLAYAVAVNGPCVVASRYNRLRIARLVARKV